jgi:hypothetical protein
LGNHAASSFESFNSARIGQSDNMMVDLILPQQAESKKNQDDNLRDPEFETSF